MRRENESNANKNWRGTFIGGITITGLLIGPTLINEGFRTGSVVLAGTGLLMSWISAAVNGLNTYGLEEYIHDQEQQIRTLRRSASHYYRLQHRRINRAK